MKNLLMVGASGHAVSVSDVVERMGGWRIAGLLDNTIPAGTRRLGYEVLGRPEEVAEIATRRQIEGVLVAVGDNWVRRRLSNVLQSAAPELAFATAIHPTAVIGKNVTVGAGT